MKFTIKVPATTANLGAGFDVAGLAVNLHNEFIFDFSKQGISFTDDQYDFKNSLTLDTFFNVLDQYNVDKPKNIHLHTISNIPIARGLGSSSTCIVAGVLAANKYARLNLDNYELSKLATQIEGHPDNVVSAIMGDLNISFIDDKLYNINTNIHQDLSLIALVPNHEVKTSDARDVLPLKYSLDEIVFNLSRIPFIKDAFENKDIDLLKQISQDKLHQDYRKSLIIDYEIMENGFKKEAIISSWISGAGPTVMLLVDVNSKDKIIKNLTLKIGEVCEILDCQINSKGAIIK